MDDSPVTVPTLPSNDVPTSNQIGSQPGAGAVYALLLAVLILAVPEVVVRDLVFGQNSQTPVLYAAFLLLGIALFTRLTSNTLRFHLPSLVAWALFCVFMLLSFVSNSTTIFVLVAQPTLILALASVFTGTRTIGYRSVFFYAALLIAVLPILSFVAHFLTPFNVLIREFFTDVTGVKQNLVFLSFSPSIYRLGSLTIPRLSSVFDEPGTFGFFASIFGSLLFLRGRAKLARLVFLGGLVSFSTAYLLFFILTVPVWMFKDFTPGRALLAASAMTGLALLIWFITPDAIRFLGVRFVYAFADSHNRTIGWQMATDSIRQNFLFGASLAGYRSRSIGASGVLVYMAYVGIPATVFLLLLVSGSLVKQMRILGYTFRDWKPIWVLGLATMITIANRNNFFNISGFTLALFSIVAASAAPRERTGGRCRRRLRRLWTTGRQAAPPEPAE